MNWKYCKKCVAMTRHVDNVCVQCDNFSLADEYSPLDDLSVDDLKVIVSQAMFLASMNDARLTILMDWLRSYSALNVSDGKLEYELAKSQEAAVHKVGEYLDEIMQMDYERLFQEAITIKLK